MPEQNVYSILPANRFKLDPEFVVDYIGKQPNWGFGLLSYVTFKRTYARRVTLEQLLAEARLYWKGAAQEAALKAARVSKQTTEEFWQTCVRVVEGISSVYKQHIRGTGQHWNDAEEQQHAQEMFRRMWALKFTPPGRGMWGMGTEAMEKKGSGMLNNCFSGHELFITKEHGPVRFASVEGSNVTVLTPDGWQIANIRAFGEQSVQDVVFAPCDFGTRNGNPRKLRSNHRNKVRVTPDHRWITLNRGEVTDLRVGDVVAAHVNRDAEETESYRAGRIHGLIFGDGTAAYQHLTKRTRAYHIRLCGGRAQGEVARFSNVTYPDSYNGDPYCHVISDVDLKAFPETKDADYLRGFLDGWIVADGSPKPEGNAWRLASQHPDAKAWLIDHAASAGWLLTGCATDSALETNYGIRTHPITAYSLTQQARGWVVT